MNVCNFTIQVIIALLLLAVGFFTLFKPKKLVNFYLSAMTNKNSSNLLLSHFIKITEKKWFYFNLKLCGVIIMIFALIILINSMNMFINITY